MIRVPLHSLKNGMNVAKPVCDIHGNILIGRGVILNDNFIQKLKELGSSSVFIQDGNTDDIIPFENISDILRETTVKSLKDLFQSVSEIVQKLKNKSNIINDNSIHSEIFKDAFLKNSDFDKIKDNLNEIINQVINREMMIGLTPLKTNNNYKYEHLVDVAVVSIMIGLRMGFRIKELRELGLGCLLHDIGETFILPEILNKPDKLNPEEMAQIQTHPLLGYKIIKDIPGIGVMPSLVALQHHERHDGTGYPRGLHGMKQMGNRHEKNVVHKFGSIAAIAEIYDALLSKRPYRQAFTREKVIKLMQDMKNKNLDGAILEKFLDITPLFPDGTIVRVGANNYYNNYMGVVTEISTDKPDRPKVRLIYNQNGESVDPIDINLVNIESKDISIESVV